tara:strand:+ start:356 stop:925 length:570 start_codon:yes stop_codon:yes gene_type:complete
MINRLKRPTFWLQTLLLTCIVGFASLVQAQLKVGDAAPSFQALGALAGQAVEFNLNEALKKGPVVLYFYPKAFTSGCTIEAQLFAESINDFKANQATVVGMSADNMKTLKEFSSGPCAGKFIVAADEDQAIIKKYDAALKVWPGVADRISYVITPDQKIYAMYEGFNPEQHVKRTLAAVQAYSKAQAQK